MIRWLRSHWPLVWRTTHELQARISRDALCVVRARADDNAAIANRLRMVMADMVNSVPSYYFRPGEKPGIAAAIAEIRHVESQIRCVDTTFISKPIARIVPGDPVRRDDFLGPRVEMLTFSMSIGLSPGVPPEMVATQIAEEVKAEVMKQWAHQSVPLRA